MKIENCNRYLDKQVWVISAELSHESNPKKNQGQVNSTVAMKIASKIKANTIDIAYILRENLLKEQNVQFYIDIKD